MTITITTTASSGHMLVYVINENNVTLLKVAENETGSISLVPGQTYRLEWHTWSPGDATYTIDAMVTPANAGFPDFQFNQPYTGPNTDLGAFPFTV